MNIIKVRVEVTERDILFGVPFNVYMGPISLALNRVVRATVWKDIRAGYGFAVIHGVLITLPKETTEFSYNFDHNDDADPISFYMNLPLRLLPRYLWTQMKRIIETL